MTYRVAQKIQRARLTGNEQVAIGSLCLPARAAIDRLSINLFLTFSALPCRLLFPLVTHNSLPHTAFPSHTTPHITAKMSEQGDEISQVTYEQLAGIEDEFEEIDTQISAFPTTSRRNRKTHSTTH